MTDDPRLDVLAARELLVPDLAYPDGLPILEWKDELVAAIRDNPVVVVAGETGSGKSTQLPKFCIEAGQGRRGLIGHTQPRRLAARAVAERIAEEMHTEVGDLVGYTVRFTDRVGNRTLVRVMTDGILLNEIQRDRSLRNYDTLIIDEAHERSLNIDFILGYLAQLRPRRPDLKVIVTSATIDTDRFSQHFGGAPVFQVSGRAHPVEVRYRPPRDDREEGQDPIQAIVDALEELRHEAPGDVLVFLSGEREIRDTADALGKLARRDTEVVPLYARLSAADQHRVFQPHRGRRIVLATNVAETSLTVPGIRYVVDPGTARISRFNRRTKVQRLPIEPISQASANQRAGRCGRVAPGICIRLYAEDDYKTRAEFTEPEVLRTNLASVILRMTAIGLGDVAAFPFMEPPDARSVADGVALLEELGAFERKATRRRLTAVGRKLAELPVDPRFARMVVEADREGSTAEVIVIVAALSIRDPREWPLGSEAEADAAHAAFVDETSDFLTYLKLWEHLQAEQAARSANQFRKLCRAEFLNFQRVREWQDIQRQLVAAARRLGIRPNEQAASSEQIHRALLAGLLSHVGMRDDPRPDLLGARGARFVLDRRSALAKKPPRWLMAGELVETNRLRGRIAARIEPSWAERLGDHLVKRSHTEPWWDGTRGAAMTEERVTLYGLPIVGHRTIPLHRVDHDEARKMFIRHALVEGDWTTHHAFVEENAALVREVENLEERVRRRDILATDDARVEFFSQRVGADAVSVRHFDTWWKAERTRQPDLLRYTLADLVDPEVGAVDVSAYPDVWPDSGLGLALDYEFDPASDFDGVTVDVPLPILEHPDIDGLDWQVAGHRLALVSALIKSLPKALRRYFSPTAAAAAEIVERADPRSGSLMGALTRELRERSGEPVPADAWSLDRVPEYLRMTYRAVDGRGRPIAWSKDLGALRAHLHPQLRAAITGAARSVEQTDLTSWTIGTLPRRVETSVAGYAVTAYPALVDEGETFGVRAFPTPVESRAAMIEGTRRFVLVSIGSPLPAVRRVLSSETNLALGLSEQATVAETLDDCVTAALDGIISRGGGPPWTEANAAALVALARDDLVDDAVRLAELAGRVLSAARAIERRLDALTAPLLQPALTDMYVQVGRLVGAHFVATAGAARLTHVPRYLQAVDRRLDKLSKDPRRDRDLMVRVEALQHALDAVVTAPVDDVDAVRWMIEELRVSFFAQNLGTAEPVSERRVADAIERLRAA